MEITLIIRRFFKLYPLDVSLFFALRIRCDYLNNSFATAFSNFFPIFFASFFFDIVSLFLAFQPTGRGPSCATRCS